MTDVILVDKDDNQIGMMEKVAAHSGDGSLHRAFTIFVFNDTGQTLVVKRSADKMLWPLFWDSACASHPLLGETFVKAGERRLVEELGFTCPLTEVDRFQYYEKFQDLGAESEVCTTLIGDYNGEVNLIPDEAADYKWMTISDLKADMVANPDIYTIWFKIALDRLIEQGKIKQEG